MFFYVLFGSSELEIPLDANDGPGEVGEALIGDPGEYGVHGILMEAIKDRKLDPLPCKTAPLDRYDFADILEAILEPPPLRFGGDWITALGRNEDSFEAHVGAIRRQTEVVDGFPMMRLLFELREA